MHPKDEELLSKPVVNYAQMKKIYTRRNVPAPNMHTPVLLIQALNFLADDKHEHTMYVQIVFRNGGCNRQPLHQNDAHSFLLLKLKKTTKPCKELHQSIGSHLPDNNCRCTYKLDEGGGSDRRHVP